MPSTVSNAKKFGFFSGGYQSKFQNFVEKILNIKIEQEETDDMIILNIKREKSENDVKEKALLSEKIINIKEEKKILNIKEEREDPFSYSYEKCDEKFPVSEEPPKPSVEAVKCTECSQEVTKYNFVEHLSSCVSKPFHCHVQGCQISFVTEDDLTQHAREVHWSPSKHRHESTLVNLSEVTTIEYKADQGEFRCDVEGCKYTNVSKAHLRSHVTRVHNSPMIKCPHANCDSLMKHSSLYQHLKSVHNDKRLCRKCDRILDHRDFDSHFKTCGDTLNCTFEGCEAVFSSLKGQRLHVSKRHLYNNKAKLGPKSKIIKRDENSQSKKPGKNKVKKNSSDLLQSLGLRLPCKVPVKMEPKLEYSEFLATLNNGCKKNGLPKKVRNIKKEKDVNKGPKVPQKMGSKKDMAKGELKRRIPKGFKDHLNATQVKKSIIDESKERAAEFRKQAPNGSRGNTIVKNPMTNGFRGGTAKIKKRVPNGFAQSTVAVKKPKSNGSKGGIIETEEQKLSNGFLEGNVVKKPASERSNENVEKTFKCGHEGCHAAFASLTRLKCHIKSVHQAPILCPREGCNRLIKLSCLKLHIRDFHDRIKKECAFCGNQYTTSYLFYHERKCAEKSASDAFAPI